LIGDLLVNFNANLNSINNESWTPFHIAARKGNKECLSWILNQNKSADQKGQKFDINMKVSRINYQSILFNTFIIHYLG